MWWRRIGDVIQAHALVLGLSGLCGGIVAWVLTVLAQMPFWIAAIFALSMFLIALAILRTILPPLFSWVSAHVSGPNERQSGERTITTGSYNEFHLQNAANVTLVFSGGQAVSASSNSVIVGADQEGILFPRGTIFQQEFAADLGFSGALSSVHEMGSGGISFVPPELLNHPPESSSPDD